MEKRLLPIGTVVVLKGGTKKAMITGYCPVAAEMPDKIFDYRGCPYPEGIIISEGTALFDHDQINEVVYKGFENDEVVDFIDRLEIILEKENG